jgi:hypothetical protein
MVDPSPGASAAAAYRGLLPPDSAPPDVGASAIRREVLMAAHEGSEHAERAEQRGIGEATLEQFRADVMSLAVQYMTGPAAGRAHCGRGKAAVRRPGRAGPPGVPGLPRRPRAR